jgi:hypothetical protein
MIRFLFKIDRHRGYSYAECVSGERREFVDRVQLIRSV